MKYIFFTIFFMFFFILVNIKETYATKINILVVRDNIPSKLIAIFNNYRHDYVVGFSGLNTLNEINQINTGIKVINYFNASQIIQEIPNLRANGISWVSYDLENNYSPSNEVNDPINTIKNLYNNLRANNMNLMLTITNIPNLYNVTRQVANYSQIFIIQGQSFQATNADQYAKKVKELYDYILADSKNINVLYVSQTSLLQGDIYNTKLSHHKTLTFLDGGTLFYDSNTSYNDIISYYDWFMSNYKKSSTTYYVSTSGNDNNDGSEISPFATFNKALNTAKCGDTIVIKPGTYNQELNTVKDACKDFPIKITGYGAIIKGTTTSTYISRIYHDHYILEGMEFDGTQGSNYVNKGIRIENVTNIIIQNIKMHNIGDEGIRIVRSSDITIQNNELYDFGLDQLPSAINGEAIYIGTAPEQNNGVADTSNNILITSNNCYGQSTECVDVKENSTNVLIQYNTFRESDDANSGIIDIRGNLNFIIKNILKNGLGAGLRLGGDTATDGINNTIKHNYFVNNAIGIKFMSHPQTIVCGNKFSSNTQDKSGTYASNYDVYAICPA
ncbi:MAG: DUF1565 domain-containing protein [Candidatus Nitrosocaldaceae archaeon]